MKTPAAQISPFGEVLEAEGMLGAHGEAQTRSVWETWSANAVSEAAQSKGGKPTTECECEKSKIKIILSILRPLELLVGRARAVLDKRSAHDRVLEESGGGVLVQQSFQQWKKLSWTFLTLTSPNISSWPSCTWTRQVRLVAIKGRLDRKRATVSWPEHKKKKEAKLLVSLQGCARVEMSALATLPPSLPLRAGSAAQESISVSSSGY